LTQLDLGANRLEQIPSWAFTYLRQLQVLKMEANRIQRIETDTFAEAHLANLRYFHLDRNRVSIKCFFLNLIYSHIFCYLFKILPYFHRLSPCPMAHWHIFRCSKC
jgi:hypothetical protein